MMPEMGKVGPRGHEWGESRLRWVNVDVVTRPLCWPPDRDDLASHRVDGGRDVMIWGCEFFFFIEPKGLV